MFCQQLIFDESYVEYERYLVTLYNQKLLNILNKISFHIFDSHIKKDRKGKNKLKDAYIPIKNLL